MREGAENKEQNIMPPQRDTTHPDILQIGTFSLDRQLYGVNILRMREILLPQDIVRVPRAPRIMEGVINLRGQVIPVVSLRARMNIPLRPFDKKTRIINMEINDMVVGFLVDSIEHIHTSNPPTFRSRRPRFPPATRSASSAWRRPTTPCWFCSIPIALSPPTNFWKVSRNKRSSSRGLSCPEVPRFPPPRHGPSRPPHASPKNRADTRRNRSYSRYAHDFSPFFTLTKRTSLRI